MQIALPRRPSLRHVTRGFLLFAVLPVALFVGSVYGNMLATTNFHSVVPGEVYRSSQPSANDIAEFQRRYGIKTIINLRGENSGRDWYEEEIAQAKELDINHIDFKMSAGRELTQPQAEELIALMRDAPKPLLIHCQAGADRTGLASALYFAAVAKVGESASEKQMSILYGHISLPMNHAYAMDRTFEKLEPWLGFSDS